MSSLSQVLRDNASRPVSYVKVKDEYYKVDRDLELMLESYATCIARADRSRKKTYAICGAGWLSFLTTVITSCFYTSVATNPCMLGSVLFIIGPGIASTDDTIQWHSQSNDLAISCLKVIREHKLKSVPEAQIDLSSKTRVVKIVHQHHKFCDWTYRQIQQQNESDPLVPNSPLSRMTQELNID